MSELCKYCERLGYCQILARKTSRINYTYKINGIISRLNQLSGRVDDESTAEAMNRKDDIREREDAERELHEAVVRECPQIMNL